ncbi:hypothetical protein QIH27_12910, partial [Klebsiella pneumoniae]|nr:hypothetical protein [Klebsiella pneumoniae]
KSSQLQGRSHEILFIQQSLKAEQLNFLMQTIFTHHKDFDCHQLDGVLGLAYDLAGEVYSWMEKEEKIVQQNEEHKRRGN